MQEKTAKKKGKRTSINPSSNNTIQPNKFRHTEEEPTLMEEENTDSLPEENPFETPSYEIPEPGEGP